MLNCIIFKMNLLAPKINYLIKNFEFNCDDIILCIQFVYFELIKTEYFMSKFEILMANCDDYVYYGFQTNNAVLDGLTKFKGTCDRILFIIFDIKSSLRVKNTYPEFIIRKFYDVYQYSIVSEINNPKFSSTSAFISKDELKLLMTNLIDIINLYNYNRIDRTYWNKNDQIKL